MHVPSTCFPQPSVLRALNPRLTRSEGETTLKASMFSPMFKRTTIAVVCAVVIALAAGAAAEPADTVLYRVFMNDGTVLVSYGEFARVADRVVLSIPVGELGPSLNLQLVSIAESTVDWDRTDGYTQAVRAKRYGETSGENDFAMLGNRVVEALNQIALAPDPARRLSMAIEARRNLARWPEENFGYRASDVGHLSAMLDEVISELRAAAGQSAFDLSFVAGTTPPAVELLPPPDLQEVMGQALAASRATVEPAERLLLLRAIMLTLARTALAGGWAAALHARASITLSSELRIDSSYRELAASSIASARSRAARADVRGVQAIVQDTLKADDRLGRQRPREMAGLLAVLDLRLEEARQMRLARDSWAMRAEAFRLYRRAVEPALDAFDQSRRGLDSIQQLAGPSPVALSRLEQRIVMGRRALDMLDVPPELQSAHALYSAAFQMGRRAVSARRNAVSSKDMKLAWEAASAASGALMLRDRAAQELDRLTTPPRNR